MQITFSPAYAISATTGQPSDLFVGIDIAITDAPALTGSEKQIAYANAIREAALKDAGSLAIGKVKLPDGSWLKTSHGGPAVLDAIAKLNEQFAPVAEKLATYTVAKDWIEAASGSKSLLTVRALLNR